MAIFGCFLKINSLTFKNPRNPAQKNAKNLTFFENFAGLSFALEFWLFYTTDLISDKIRLLLFI